MKNLNVRARLRAANLHQWQLAQQLGIYPSTLTVWLRTELAGERLERVNRAMDELGVR